MSENKNLVFSYSFRYSDGSTKELTLELDNQTLSFINKDTNTPSWAKLDRNRCPNCNLDPEEHELCPIAKNLTGIVKMFQNSDSSEKIEVTVKSNERIYIKQTTLQRGLSSVIGIIMTTSGCTILDRLRPLVRYHLPLASLDETRFRVISMYLLAQYYREKNGLEPDWKLNDLSKIYAEIQIVNKFFCDRLISMKMEDASINALTVLNCFANYIPFSLTEDLLSNMDSSFKIFLQE